MALPLEIVKALEEAVAAIDHDIQSRMKTNQSASDLERMKLEINEMRLEQRKQISEGLSYMIIDSMDWDQPCLKPFNKARELLRKHYKTRP